MQQFIEGYHVLGILCILSSSYLWAGILFIFTMFGSRKVIIPPHYTQLIVLRILDSVLNRLENVGRGSASIAKKCCKIS